MKAIIVYKGVEDDVIENIEKIEKIGSTNAIQIAFDDEGCTMKQIVYLDRDTELALSAE